MTVAQSSDWQVAGIGDFNGDGRSDILWRNADGWVTDWLGAGDGFTGNWSNVTIYQAPDLQVAGFGDFNGDGMSDVLWRSADGTITNWLASGNGFAGNWTNLTAAQPTGWQVAGIGDFNGDGRDDILWRKDDGTITDWLGQANGGFADNSAVASQPLSIDYQVVGVGDFNGDGRSDLLLQVDQTYLETWIGSSQGAFWSPLEKLFHEEVGYVQDLVDVIASSTVDSGDGGGSGAPQDTSGGRIMFSQLFGLQVNVDVSQLTLFSPQLEDFTIIFSDDGFTFTSDGHFVDVTESAIQIGEYYVNVDGFDFVSHMVSGQSSPAIEPGSIVITARSPAGTNDNDSAYWAFDPSLSGINLLDGFGGGGSGNMSGGVHISPGGAIYHYGANLSLL